jgi:hypothetical protein
MRKLLEGRGRVAPPRFAGPWALPRGLERLRRVRRRPWRRTASEPGDLCERADLAAYYGDADGRIHVLI